MSDFVIENGVLIAYNGDEQEIELPDEVTEIGDFAFSKNTNITSVILPYGTTRIGDCTFRGCSNLVVVIIPDTVTYIDEDAFSKCSSDLILAVMHDSYAEQYAIENNFTVHYLKVVSGEDDYDFSEFEIEDCIVKKYIGSREHVNIPPYVNEIGEFAFNRNTDVISVSIPDTVSCISECAFRGCTNLEEVIIPESVTFIDEDAFEKCPNVTLKVVSDSYAEQYAIDNDIDYEICDDNSCEDDDECSYNDCDDSDFEIDSSTGLKRLVKYNGNYESVRIPEGVEDIDDFAFNCTYQNEIKEIIIPNSVDYIDTGSFIWCDNLCRIKVCSGNKSFCSVDGVLYSKDKETVICCPAGYEKNKFIIPNGVHTIAENAFAWCQQLSEIVIPNTVTRISYGAFKYCTSLREITIPPQTSYINTMCVNGCSNLERINVQKANRSFASEDGILYSYDKTQLLRFPPAHYMQYFTIPDSVREIFHYAFDCCTSLCEVNMPDTISYIGTYAFANCNNITSITIPDNVSWINEGTFSNCCNLEDVFISYVIHIDKYAFSGCSSLSYITFPDNIDTIEDEAFKGCSNLTDLTVPWSVRHFGDNIFEGCDDITLHVDANYWSDAEEYAKENSIKYIDDVY